MSFVINLRIFSPRWGHEDSYSVNLERDFLEITMQTRKTKAIWKDNRDPEWSGESLQEIMENDHIYPPAVTQDLFEHVWKEWRNGVITDQEAEKELQEVAVWLNAVTRAKPNTEFWNSYF